MYLTLVRAREQYEATRSSRALASYWQGNLENALNSLVALAILHTVVCGRTASSIFANSAIIYPLGDPSISEERLLFPQYACDDKPCENLGREEHG